MFRKRTKRRLSQQPNNQNLREGLRRFYALILIHAILIMTVVPWRAFAATQPRVSSLPERRTEAAPEKNIRQRENTSKAAESVVKADDGLAERAADKTATELENGDVLIVGGGAAEIYFAASGLFGATGTLNTPREHHAAVRLNDGRVLIAGGEANGETLASVEIFDPSSGTFSPIGKMNTPRVRQTMTLLADGRVLIAGDGTAEIYDAENNRFTPIGAMTASRRGHSAIALNDGRVLIVGGTDSNGETLASAEVFEASTNEFRPIGGMANARKDALLRVLHDGKVQIIGGADESSMEVFDPNGEAFGARVKIPADGSHFPELFDDIMSSPTRAAIIGKNTIELPQTKKALVYTDGSGLKNGNIFDSSKATVSTEALKYTPGSPIVVSGKGFQPSETVQLVFYQTENADANSALRFTTQADENGAFRFDGFSSEDKTGTFLIAAEGEISGEKGQTPVENVSGNITQIGFNPTGAVSTFIVGVSNPSVTAGTGFRVRTLDSTGAQENVTGGGSVTVQLSSSSPNGQFSTNSAGPFNSTLSLSINSGSANTPNFYYRDTNAGTPTITATVTARTSGVSNLPLNSTATQNLTVNKANSATVVTLTAGTNPSIFGEAVSFTATATHGSGGAGTPSGTVTFKDGATIIGTPQTLSGSGQATVTVSTLTAGNHSITAEYGGDGNFNTSTSAAFSHSVDLSSQTIVFEPLNNKNYGDADFTVDATGGDSGNPVTFSSSSTFCTVTSGGLVHLTGAGTCSITANQAGSSNYAAATPVTQSFSVAQKSLTATVNVENKVYDGTTTATIVTRTLSGVINSDDVTVGGGTATFNNKNVGTDKPVTVSGLTLGGAKAASYVLTGVDPVDADITQRDLTVTVSAQDKTYDGSATAMATITGDDRISGDDVATAFTSASFDNKNAGVSKTVTVSGVSITGGMDMGNYSIVSSATTTADIDPLAITVDVVVSDKIYDRTTAAAITSRTLNGVISPDDVTVSGGTATFANNEDAENDKPVTISGLTLGGMDANNYSITGNASATADIDPKPITVTATADDKPYDTTTTATVSLTSSDVISPDVVTFASTSANFASADVGTHTVTVSGISLGGADASNYSVANPMGTATDLADIAQIDSSPQFTSTNPVALRFNETYQATATTTGDGALTISASPGSVCTISPSNLVTIVAGSGTCTITATTADGTNYRGSSATQTISADKATAILAFDVSTLAQFYDGSLRVVTASTTPNGLTGVSVTYDGLPTAPTAAGSYTVVASLTNDNYAAADITATLVVSRVASTTTFTSTAPSSLQYNQTYAATATTNGDGALTITASPSSVCTIDASNVVTIVSGSGTCTVTATTAQGSNYDGSSATQTITAQKAAATITLSNVRQNYNGSPRSITVATNPTGLESNVSVTYDGSLTAPTNAGSYAVIAVLTDDNYAAPDATDTLIIDPATQSIDFTNPGPKIYGDTPFSLVATGGSSSSPVTFSSQTPSVCAVSGSTATIVGAGSCTIRASQAGDMNYSAAPDNDQIFTVAKALLNVTADNQMITFGQPDPPFTFSYDGFVNGDDEFDIDTPPTCDVSVPHTDAGSYSITCSGGADDNYSFGTYNPGTLTISRAGQTISFTNPGTKTYGDADFGLTAAGGASGNPLTFVSDTSAVCTVSGSTLHIVSAGTCMVTASQAGNGNYDPASSVQQSFAINKADATIVVNGGTFPYDGLPHSATGTATGVFSENLNSLLDLGAAFTNVSGGSADWTFAGNDNYNSASGSVNIVIEALATTTTVTFEPAPYVYRGTAFTATAVVTSTDGFSQTLTVDYGSSDCTNVTMSNGCTATASFAGDGNHSASSGSASITIVKAPSSTVLTFDQALPFVYTGNPFTASARVTGAGGLDQPVSVVYSGDCTNASAGGCTATADFTGDGNHEQSSDSKTITITQASSSTVVTFVSSPPHVYTGNPFTATARVTGSGGLDSDITGAIAYSGDCTNVSMANGCTASASFTGDSNHAPSSNSASITIIPASATLSLSGLSQTYDSNPKSVTVTTTPNGLSGVSVLYSSLSYPSSSIPPSDAGSYDVTASLSNVNYTAPDATGTLVIGRSSQTISFDTLGDKTYGDPDFTISASSSSMLDVSFSSQTSSVCTVSSSSSVWSVHIVSAGVCTIRASQPGSSNYEPAADADQSFTIAKYTPTVSVTGGTFTYDGNPHSATGMVTGANSEDLGTPDFTYTPPGDSTAPINAGVYSVVGSFAGNTNYTSATSSAAGITINQASQAITFGMLPNRTYGDAPFTVSATGGGSGNPVTFAASGQCSVSGNTVTLIAAGSCTITASQAGNGNYSAAASVMQPFTIAPNTTPVNVFIQSPLNSQLTGTTLTVPVMIQGVNGHDIEAFQFRMNYDPNVLTPLSTPYDQTGTISNAFNIASSNSSGQLTILGDSGGPVLVGGGVLLNLKFSVSGTVPSGGLQSCLNLSLSNVRLNETVPVSVGGPVQFCVINGQVSGKITYPNSSTPDFRVPGVTLTAVDGINPNLTAASDSSGLYSLSGFFGNNYVVTPTRTPNLSENVDFDCGAISGSDVTRIRNFLLNPTTTPLTADQQFAADVSGNGDVSALDVSQIRRYILNQSDPNAGQTGTWKFKRSNSENPNEDYTAVELQQNISNQDYRAYLIGDVTGNWTPNCPAAMSNLSSKGDETSVGKQEKTEQLGAPVNVSVVSTSASSGASFNVPIQVDDTTGLAIEAYQFDVTYDPAVLQPQGTGASNAGTLSSSLTISTAIVSPGRLRVLADSQGTLLAGSGVLLNLRFTAVGANGTSSNVDFLSFRFNEGVPTRVLTGGSVSLLPPTAANVSVSGKIVSSDGSAVNRATVILTDSRGESRSAASNNFGNFSFSDVAVGETYTISVRAKGLRFTPQVVSVADSISRLVLIAEP